MNPLANMEQSLIQLGTYVGKPLTTPADRERALELHSQALTQCRFAMLEQQVSQEQKLMLKMESIEDIVMAILTEMQQLKVLS